LRGGGQEHSALTAALEDTTSARAEARAAPPPPPPPPPRSVSDGDHTPALLAAEVATLRQQLARADELRERSQQSLDALKQQFDALTHDLQSPRNNTLSRTAAAATSPSPPPRPPGARSPPPVSSTRAVDVLERCVAATHPGCWSCVG
jgi:hypothetical protein